MNRMTAADTRNAISGVTALRMQLCAELDAIERLVGEIDPVVCDAAHVNAKQLVEVYRQERVELVSALASIDEVLRWLRLTAMAEDDGDTPWTPPTGRVQHNMRKR